MRVYMENINKEIADIESYSIYQYPDNLLLVDLVPYSGLGVHRVLCSSVKEADSYSIFLDEVRDYRRIV